MPGLREAIRLQEVDAVDVGIEGGELQDRVHAVRERPAIVQRLLPLLHGLELDQPGHERLELAPTRLEPAQHVRRDRAVVADAAPQVERRGRDQVEPGIAREACVVVPQPEIAP